MPLILQLGSACYAIGCKDLREALGKVQLNEAMPAWHT
jgi:hypothetical protein